MKSYIDLVIEMLGQRGIVDNRNIVDLSETSASVLTAFNQACEFMRDLHNWKWNTKEIQFLNDPGQNAFPMPYGIVQGVSFKKQNGKPCEMQFVEQLTADKGCPSQWTHDWANEQILIAPAASTECDELTYTTIKYNDRNIACVGNRTAGVLLPKFDTTTDPETQFLNVPEYIYDAYARCVILKARVFLNENAQTTIFPAQEQEWTEAYNGLMSYAKTPFYTSERTVL